MLTDTVVVSVALAAAFVCLYTDELSPRELRATTLRVFDVVGVAERATGDFVPVPDAAGFAAERTVEVPVPPGADEVAARETTRRPAADVSLVRTIDAIDVWL